MTLDGFSDELRKLASTGRLPLHSIGALVRRGMGKRASGLGVFHNDTAPQAPVVDPADAAMRLPDAANVKSQIRPGALGGVTPSTDPIDREKFNRVWGPKR